MTARVLSNYHTHSCFCDGENTIEEMVLAAIEKGFQHLGITSHAYIPNQEDWTMEEDAMEEYIHEINWVKDKYRDQINIYTGLEMDYFYQFGWYPVSIPYIEQLDFNIGSVHCLYKGGNWEQCYVDDTKEAFEKGIEDLFHGNIEDAVKHYYNSINEMVTEYQPTIVGHIDLIKKNNGGNAFFNESENWYREIIQKTLHTISKSSSIIEINTGGIARHGEDLLYPSIPILEEMYRMGMDVTVNSDCHNAADMDCYYDDVYRIIKSIGYERVLLFTDRGWEAIKI